MNGKNKVKKPVYRCECDDCGFDVLSGGEFFMLNPEIWDDQLGMEPDDNLCVGCIERRLGRRIDFADIINYSTTQTQRHRCGCWCECLAHT